MLLKLLENVRFILVFRYLKVQTELLLVTELEETPPGDKEAKDETVIEGSKVNGNPLLSDQETQIKKSPTI